MMISNYAVIHPFIEKRATRADIEAGIRSTFPKLGSVEFELLRAVTGGKAKPLKPLCSVEPIPGADIIRGSRLSIAYVRPLFQLYVVSNSTCLAIVLL